MRSATGNGPRDLEDAGIRRAALLTVDADDVVLSGYDADAVLFRRLIATPRLQRRLFERLAGSAGDPATADADLRRLLLLSPDDRAMAAVCAGLTYHLHAFGAVLAIDALTSVFGKTAAHFAATHAALSPLTTTVLDMHNPETERIVRADGGHILFLWASHCGLAGLWRATLDDMDAPGSAVLFRNAAIEIGAAISRFGLEKD